ncbi:hypothetical protein HAX54_035337, partial [Datura stramonium]|nr:hypothetical protein [Datura stramonium]
RICYRRMDSQRKPVNLRILEHEMQFGTPFSDSQSKNGNPKGDHKMIDHRMAKPLEGH